MIITDPKAPVLHPPPRDRLFGVYPALVTSVKDPDNQGRIEVTLPWVDEEDGRNARAWARLATMMGGADRGSWFIPEVDDEVLIAFAAGDPRRPIMIGALWNGADAPPEQMDGSGNNNIRSITSRSGHKLTFDDTSGAEVVSVKTQGGHEVKLDDGGQAVRVTHSGGAKIEIDASGTIKITATNQVQVDAPAGMLVKAAQVTVNAALSKFSGIVQADTVITNAVFSSTYTPGLGNVL